jgi:ribose transport system ATP-binding protein
VGLDAVDPRTLVCALGPVQQTLVAMARALRGLQPGRGVLVLDEPTARLPHDQVDELVDRCRRLRDQGIALVYVSHRLDEVFAMADRVSVLRDGKLVFDGSIDETDNDHLTQIITGPGAASDSEAAPTRERSADHGDTAPRISLRGVSGTNVRDVDLDLYPGEVLAITGLVGSGRSELGRLLFGSQPITAGEIRYLGEPLVNLSPERSIRRGIGYVPQDRKQSAIADFTLAENLCLASLEKHFAGGRLSAASEREVTAHAIERLDVRPPDPARRLGELSGGNQQKIVLGKWLELDLQVLILDEPTYGVDVGARRTILRAVLERVKERDLAVLLLDSDIDLVAGYADRVLVMRRGRITSELVGSDITVDQIAAASYAVQDTPTA